MRGDDVLQPLRNFNEDYIIIHPSVDFNDFELFLASLQGEIIDEGIIFSITNIFIQNGL